MLDWTGAVAGKAAQASTGVMIFTSTSKHLTACVSIVICMADVQHCWQQLQCRSLEFVLCRTSWVLHSLGIFTCHLSYCISHQANKSLAMLPQHNAPTTQKLYSWWAQGLDNGCLFKDRINRVSLLGPDQQQQQPIHAQRTFLNVVYCSFHSRNLFHDNRVTNT